MKTYNDKRNFSKTREPKDDGTRKKSRDPIFVIQKHDATNLHYDFRLEIAGSLKSWSVPKGPSTNPSVKRMAIPTEDHPIPYADFEGNIPEGEYGGGTVMIWDNGKVRSIKKDEEGKTIPLEDSFEAGSLEIELKGQKLMGGYNLIRMKGGKMSGNWLLIKQEDQFAGKGKEITQTRTESAVSGRSLSEIEQEEK